MKVVNTLLNNIFKYQITLYDKTVLPITIHTAYFFKLSTDSKYNDIKFKRLFIDLKAITELIKGIC